MVMRKNRINSALNELIDERRAGQARAGRLVMGRLAGDDSGILSVDISGIRVLSGLNILAESLIRSLVEQSVFGHGDVHAEQRVNPDLQPELHAAGVSNVTFSARLTVVEALPQFFESIGFQIRYMMNAIQSDEIYGELFPPEGREPRGILFPFHRGDESDLTGFFYLIEHVQAGRFLRITLESALDSRLRLTRIPHATVGRIDLVHTRVDIPGAAARMAQGVREACGYQKWNYSAAGVHFEDYFQFLRMAGYAELETTSFSWPAAFLKMVPAPGSAALGARILRVLYVLGNTSLTAQLKGGRAIRLDDAGFFCYLDLSQRDRCLNISLLEPRVKSGLPACLARMPAVREAAEKQPDTFRNVRVLLVHHLTAEVLGFIQALADMGASHVDTLWVKYAGAVETAYKEIMLSLPETMFHFHGLTPVLENDGVQARFLLSEEFSGTAALEPLAALLRETPLHFFEAMRAAAGHMLFNLLLASRGDGSRLMIIEDGGYIAPSLNRLCLENRTVGEAAKFFGFPAARIPGGDMGRPFGEWLRPIFAGSVEHTRNGYDALRNVEAAFGRLAFPALSIAISRFKVNNESRDVVYSCLNAVESIMNHMGFALSERTSVVLGSQGALGRKAMSILSGRLGAENLFGVDIAAPESLPPWTHASGLASLPEQVWRRADLFFGVIGASIFQPEWVERLVLETERADMFFASGSTKTVEFSHLSGWLSECLHAPRRLVNGEVLDVTLSEIHDPKTGIHQGRSAKLVLGAKTVHLHLLADLMPVNFLYYGVPSETMNRVMAELLELSALLIRRERENDPLPSALLALDHDITIS